MLKVQYILFAVFTISTIQLKDGLNFPWKVERNSGLTENGLFHISSAIKLLILLLVIFRKEIGPLRQALSFFFFSLFFPRIPNN